MRDFTVPSGNPRRAAISLIEPTYKTPLGRLRFERVSALGIRQPAFAFPPLRAPECRVPVAECRHAGASYLIAATPAFN